MAKLAALILATLLLGCATAPKSTLDVAKPRRFTVENERYFDLPFDRVWQSLIEDLAKSFFVVNNISKESNFISLSFSTPDPQSYVDCGTSTWTYEGQTYAYPIAGQGFYKTARQAGENAYYVYSIQRDTSLEGRINVYVAPEGDGTKVSVNVKYLMTVTKTGTAEGIAGVLQIHQGTQALPKETATIDFNTNQDTTLEEVACVSTGKLETTILDMVLE